MWGAKRHECTIIGALFLSLIGGTNAEAQPGEARSPVAHQQADEESTEVMEIIGQRSSTATSTQTVPADHFELRPLESGGQMLEAVPNLVTAQHTGGGKAEQYFIRGFDADHGTDLAVYFDGVPVNLRSHAHGQGFLDLHFVTPETIERLDANKGPYLSRYGDFATAATIDYVPSSQIDQSMARFEAGEFDTLRAVGVLAPASGPFDTSGPARGFVSFEAYHTDGPFKNDEDLWRYSALARAEVDLGPDLMLSGHVLGYYADWNASGLVPKALVRDDTIDRFGSLDPTEGGQTTRAQAKLQLDWEPSDDGHFMLNAYVSYYDFELFSNFTYFLNDPINGDGIVQRDKDRVFGGGRLEYVHNLELPFPLELRTGTEMRYDDTRVFLGTQTRRNVTGTTSDDKIEELSVEPYIGVEAQPLPWMTLEAGLRFAWFRFDGEDALTNRSQRDSDDSQWLPKANLILRPFSDLGPIPTDVDGLRDLELFLNFGIGYHSNDARVVFSGGVDDALTRATGVEVGLRTSFLDKIDVALDGWYLNLEDELVFVGDEGTTESAGETNRLGVELAATAWPLDWWYLRGDVAYTSVRLDDGDAPVAQAPRFVAKAATGVRYEGFAAELNLRHLGERYATDDQRDRRLSDYTVLDIAARYRWRFFEVGIAVENIGDTNWSSSEFYYESQPTPAGASSEDFHFSPGNPRNVRGWISAYY
jgi:hypothetical protein